MCWSVCTEDRSKFMDLSVIIHVHDGQSHIAGCLRSVTRCPREHIDMECIVVGGSAKDECAAIVYRYAQRDNRIKLAVLEGGETSDARNAGIEAASGRYILFLDAADRLCEDAWDQIEAAVGEEYADFVAFSHITSLGNGKLKAQMLPISDVISTDEREARRLMYADSVLDTCVGKLFKSRIIRDNNILFRSDLMFEPEVFKGDVPSKKSWDGVDSVFVAEYFEHSESYLLTKAMIWYAPPRNKYAVKQHSIKDRVELLGILYDHHVSAVKRYNDSELMACMKIYFLKSLMDLFGEYVEACCYRRDVVDTLYEGALGTDFLKKFLNELNEQEIHSKIRQHEYRLLRQGKASKIRRYCAVRTGNMAKIRRYFR